MLQPQVRRQLSGTDIEADETPGRTGCSASPLDLAGIVEGDVAGASAEGPPVQPDLFLAQQIDPDHAFIVAVPGEVQACAGSAGNLVLVQPGITYGVQREGPPLHCGAQDTQPLGCDPWGFKNILLRFMS